MSEQDTIKSIENDIKNNKVMLYMKGEPSMPQCGFSRQVVHILNKHGVRYATKDVLRDPALRDEIKKFSNWPTIPQLYIDGKFIGGCDIVTEMDQNGELEKLLKG